MGIDFKELAGSPVKNFGPNGATAHREIVVAYTNEMAMVAELLGDSFVFGGAGQKEFPDLSFLVATKIKSKPRPTDAPDEQGQFTDIETEVNTYPNFVQLSVDYELRNNMPFPPPEELEDGTFLSYRMDFGGEYIQIGSNTLKWNDQPNQPVDADITPTIRVPIIEHHVTWHRVINPPWATIRSQIGSVNSVGIFGFDAGFLLFDGCTADREFTGIDQLNEPQFGYRMSYVFREKHINVLGAVDKGWQFTYRTKPENNPGWDTLIDGAGNNIYVTADHNLLFKFAAVT